MRRSLIGRTAFGVLVLIAGFAPAATHSLAQPTGIPTRLNTSNHSAAATPHFAQIRRAPPTGSTSVTTSPLCSTSRACPVPAIT